jgi:predicted small lipoprotein YifL
MKVHTGGENMRMKKSLKTVVALLAFVVLAGSGRASFADEAKVPQTAAEHEAMAKQYKDQAAQFKKVADDHKAMAEAYKKTIAMPEMKGGKKNPWLAKMEKHCEMLAKDAEKLAADSEKAADFQTQRAKEVGGK